MARFFDYSTCPPDDHSELGFMANPTGAGKRSRGGSASYDDAAEKQAERKGAMLANLGIVAACAAFNALCGGVLLGVKSITGRSRAVLKALATVRFPSFSLFPCLFMLQNVLEPALNLIFYDPIPGHKILAVVVALGTFLLPAACWFITSPPHFQALYVADPGMKGKPRLPIFLWGDHKWICTDQDLTFERRYALVFKDFKYEYRRFLLMDIGVVMVISALSAFVSQNATHCTVQIALASLVEIIYIAIVIKCRPFIADLDHWYTIALTCCQVGAILMALVAMHKAHAGLLGTSAGLLILATFFMLVKSVFDMYTFVKDRCSERKTVDIDAVQLQLASFDAAANGGELGVSPMREGHQSTPGSTYFGVDVGHSDILEPSMIAGMALQPGTQDGISREELDVSLGRVRAAGRLSPGSKEDSPDLEEVSLSGSRKNWLAAGRGVTLPRVGSVECSAECPGTRPRRMSGASTSPKGSPRIRAGTVNAPPRGRRKGRGRGAPPDPADQSLKDLPEIPILSRSMNAPPSVPISGQKERILLSQSITEGAYFAGRGAPASPKGSPRRRRVTTKKQRLNSTTTRPGDGPGSPRASSPLVDAAQDGEVSPDIPDPSPPGSPRIATASEPRSPMQPAGGVSGVTAGRGRRVQKVRRGGT